MKTTTTAQAETSSATLWRCGGRQCGAGECEHEENELHRHASGSGGPRYAPPIVHDVLRSSGAPLPAQVRADMEHRLGHDFADVRIHTDSRAGSSAEQVEALAWTVGRHVAFAPGQFDPGSETGRRLIAHELTHAAANASGSTPTGRLRVSSPDEPAERHAAHSSQWIQTAAPMASPGLMRQQAPVDMTALRVNHPRVTVPPESGLSFSAVPTPPNPTGLSLTLVGVSGTAIDAGTTITNSGVITVSATQAGGPAKVEGRQAYTRPDGARVSSTTPFSAPFNFVALPGPVSSTSASTQGRSGEYGALVRQTFTGGRAIERAHVNERFAGSTTTRAGTTLSLTDAMFPGGATVHVNDPEATSGPDSGWDLDATGTLSGDDHVTWSSRGPTARPFVRNASNPTPSATLPHSADAVQSFHNLSFPSATYGGSAVATVTHQRMLEDRNGAIKAVTRALPAGQTTPEVVEGYVGPPVFRGCQANPASVAPSPASGSAHTSTVTVERHGARSPATSFSLQGPALGCRVNRHGVVTVGRTAGSITVRAGVTANYDECTITIAAPTPATPAPGTPAPGTPGTPTP